jgi:hypothetical protein
MSTPETQAQAPDTLPANYFDSPQAAPQGAQSTASAQQTPAQGTAPDTLPADYFDQPTSKPEPEAKGTIAVPAAGHIPGVMSFGNKVTPEQAAGGIATGAAVGALPFATSGLAAGLRAAPAVGEAVMGHLEAQAAEWMENYPALTKLLLHAGIPSSIAGTIGYLIHKAK